MKDLCQNTIYCPLCQSKKVQPYHRDGKREYIHCLSCELVFVPSLYWLAAVDERAVYDLHENAADDPGYRKFLSRLTTPLLERLRPNQSGLDFGCGPGPTLSILMEEQGHSVVLYDPFYAKNPEVFKSDYDFICATEVVEHLHNPNRVFSDLFTMVRPGGWLGIMTKLVTGHENFCNWHYIRDMTHICFYHKKTFIYLAERFDAKLSFIGKDVILFQNHE